jgi:pre-rRNA-processing protein TSR2
LLIHPPILTHHPVTIQSQFEQGVAYALHLWPDLTLAVQNNWGGPDSSDKRDWFAGAVVDLFPDLSKPASTNTAPSSTEETPADEEPDSAYVEEFLLQVMLDEFEVNVDDDSSYEVAEQIIRVRGDCLKGRFDEVERLRERWEGKKGKKEVFKKAEDEDGETDWDDEDDSEEDGDEDVEMGNAPPPVARKEKEEPEVDEEGFTMVKKKR